MDNPAPWRILIVDDEEGVHGLTRMIFRGYRFEDRPVELLSAMNGAEARTLLRQQPDICLVLLDVVMESDDEGLRLVDHIRAELGNRDMRIILRTGHPGLVPETEVIVKYDINDYLSKSELSASRLLTSVVVALRSYRDISQARHHRQAQSAQPTRVETTDLLSPIAQPLLLQSRQQLQRLQQLELSPMARDLLQELNCNQLRLQTLFQPLTRELIDQELPQPSDPRRLIESLVADLLPLARHQRRLLDYRFGEAVPKRLKLRTDACHALYLGLLDHALSVDQGPDLRLFLDYSPRQFQLELSIEGKGPAVPGGAETGRQKLWHATGQRYFDRLAKALGGSLTLLADEPDNILFRCAFHAEACTD